VDDASEGFEEFQRNVKKLLGPRDGRRADWIALATPDLDRVVQRALERVLRALDLPRRSDLEALEKRLDQLLAQMGAAVPPREPTRIPEPAREPRTASGGES
jgi:hypothetical protein